MIDKSFQRLFIVRTESLIRVCYFAVKFSKEALVIDAHSFQEIHLKLLSVTAQLSSQPVALRLKFFLCDILRLKIFELSLEIDNFWITVLVQP